MSRYATLFKTIPHIDINTATLETCRGVWAAIRPAMATLYNNDILESRAALLALKRQNEVCPTDDSLAYLGVLEINSHNRLSTDKATRAEANRSYAVGMKLLQHANKENRNNPVALNHLANHFFVSVPHEQRSYDQVRSLYCSLRYCTRGLFLFEQILNLTKSALTYATDNQTRAESYYQMGRVHHAQSDFTNALSSYQQSLKQVPTFIMPLFGIAQIFIHQSMRRLYQLLCLRFDSFFFREL
jgi:tetratricopeptide (TPR) repeat protein